MKALHVLLVSALAVVSVQASQAASVDDYSKTIAVFRDSPLTQPYFANGYGYAVFPVVGKGGMVLGGAFGKGQVYRQGNVTGHASLAHLSIGLQMGGQAFSEIIFFEDKRAYDEFTRGSVELDAKASAVAVTAAAQAEAGTTGIAAGASAGPNAQVQLTARYVKGLAVFVHIKGGLMYEAAVGGQKFSFRPL
jgi:lipid-binding SYLF domain-containing protein